LKKVHEENLHIEFGMNRSIPDPDIAVDDAWQSMQQLLNKDMCKKTVPPFFFNKGRILLFIFLVLGLSGLLFTITENKKPLQKQDTTQTEIEQYSGVSNKPKQHHKQTNFDSLTRSIKHSTTDRELSQDTVYEDHTFHTQAVKGKQIIADTDSAGIKSDKKSLTTGFYSNTKNGQGYSKANSPKKYKKAEQQRQSKLISTRLSKEKKSAPVVNSQRQGRGIQFTSTEVIHIVLPNAVSPAVSDRVKKRPSALPTFVTDSMKKILILQLAGKEKPDDHTPFKLHYGLRWNLPLPLQGTNNFFTGVNAKNQVYLILLPQVYVAINTGKQHEIGLQVDPLSTTRARRTLLGSTITSSGLPDSSLVTLDTSFILSRGLSAGIHYNYDLSKHFTIGVSLNYQWQSKALFETSVRRGVDTIAATHSLLSVNKTASAYQYLQTGYFFTRFDLGYNFNRFQLGGSLIIPIGSVTADKKGVLKPLNAQLYVRWKIR
jgi:hypothetical protein